MKPDLLRSWHWCNKHDRANEDDDPCRACLVEAMEENKRRIRQTTQATGH